MQLTECKANHFKTEMDRLRERQMKVEREKHDLEKKIRDADFYMLQLTVENDKREAETEKLKKELICAKMAEREATARLLNFLNRERKSSTDSLLTASTVSHPNHVNNPASIAAISTPSLTTSSSTNDMETAGGAELTTSTSASHHYIVMGDNSSGISDDFEPKEFILTDNEMEQITNEMERSHMEYLRKSKKQVQNQLQTLRSEIAPHKIDENQSNLDILSEAQIKAGENKYSTLKKLKSGSTKARVAFFEEL